MGDRVTYVLDDQMRYEIVMDALVPVRDAWERERWAWRVDVTISAAAQPDAHATHLQYFLDSRNFEVIMTRTSLVCDVDDPRCTVALAFDAAGLPWLFGSSSHFGTRLAVGQTVETAAWLRTGHVQTRWSVGSLNRAAEGETLAVTAHPPSGLVLPDPLLSLNGTLWFDAGSPYPVRAVVGATTVNRVEMERGDRPLATHSAPTPSPPSRRTLAWDMVRPPGLEAPLPGSNESALEFVQRALESPEGEAFASQSETIAVGLILVDPWDGPSGDGPMPASDRRTTAQVAFRNERSEMLEAAMEKRTALVGGVAFPPSYSESYRSAQATRPADLRTIAPQLISWTEFLGSGRRFMGSDPIFIVNARSAGIANPSRDTMVMEYDLAWRPAWADEVLSEDGSVSYQPHRFRMDAATGMILYYSDQAARIDATFFQHAEP